MDNQDIGGVNEDQWHPTQYRAKKNGKRPFAIWSRYKPDTFPEWTMMHDWHICRRYETEAQRDEAFKALVRKIDFREFAKEKPE